MTKKAIDITGKVFGRLKVLGRCYNKKYVNGEAIWECLCSCEKKTIVYAHGSCLRQGTKKSCGCILKPGEIEYLRKLQIRLLENSKLNVASQCMEWTGFITKGGYGSLSLTKNGKERPVHAHRATWMVYRGEIPKNMFVCHKCDNPLCVNIYHLFLGTHEDNMKDKIRKGRANIPKGIHCRRSKLNNKKVKEILASYGNGISSHELAKKYGVAASTIRSIWQRKNWKHIKLKE